MSSFPPGEQPTFGQPSQQDQPGQPSQQRLPEWATQQPSAVGPDEIDDRTHERAPQQPQQQQPSQQQGGYRPGHLQPGQQQPDHQQGQQPGQQWPAAPQSAERAPKPQKPAKQKADRTSLSKRVIFGLHPVLFVALMLLVVVTIGTIVLIFAGDFEGKVSRVVATVLVFIAFTGLLALDLSLARRRALPLVIGVIANTWMLAVLMVVIWITPQPEYVPLFLGLLGPMIMLLIITRGAAAAAWGLIVLGERGANPAAYVVGLVAASLVGLTGILLSIPFAVTAFELELPDIYWRLTVAVLVIAALATSTTVLLFWNARNSASIARDEEDARLGIRRERPAAPQTVFPQQTRQQQSQPGFAYPAPAPVAQEQPTAGLLPWPTDAQGMPLPMLPDGQPDFSARR